ncbi:nuclear transport factor 2 family protein [Leadbetterella sp. DM7]|uniref:nuclear transport factor 2 family protein n=1 Tax=Leadbetterella sp. DM7 TaxID=3235085 RepID=UPI00349EF428
MKKYLTVTLLLACLAGYAQTTETDSIKETINRFFGAMKSSDSSGVKSTLAAGIIFQSITSKNEVRTEDVQGFIGSVARAPEGSLDERITFASVLVDGNLAAVWTPYEFYYNGQFSHCGVNSFQLHKENGTWKIRYIIDTRRKEGCK